MAPHAGSPRRKRARAEAAAAGNAAAGRGEEAAAAGGGEAHARRGRAAQPPPQRRRVTVLVDMDGVLCDFDARVNERYAALFPGQPVVPLSERRDFYMAKDYHERFGPEAAQRVRDICGSQGFFEGLEPITGALAAVKDMAAHPRLNVIICTAPLSRFEFVLVEKFRWVEKHLGREWIDKIVLTRDKTVVDGRVLIDDRPHVTGSHTQPTWEHVLFDQAYNRQVPGKRRLKSWAGAEWRALVAALVAELDE